MAFVVSVVHSPEQVGRPGDLELHDYDVQARVSLEHAPEKIMSHIDAEGQKTLLARPVASLIAPVAKLLWCRFVAVCRLSGIRSRSAAAQKGSYSGL